MKKTIQIPKKEYQELKKYKQIDTKLLEDISKGINDILAGKIKEI